MVVLAIAFAGSGTTHGSCLRAQSAGAVTPKWVWERPEGIAHPDLDWVRSSALDEARGRVVCITQGAQVRVHEWDGEKWTTKATPLSPSGREGCSVAYDPVRKTILLFGGHEYPYQGTFATHYNELWEWNGTVWRQVSSANRPPPRAWAGMAVDRMRSRVVLYGGAGSLLPWYTYLRDTWEWDGIDWRRVYTKGDPGPAAGTCLGYDETLPGRIVMFGADASLGALPNETWEYDGHDWSQYWSASGPGQRVNSQMIYHRQRGALMLYGGNGSGSIKFNDMWAWSNHQWVAVATPTRPAKAERSTLSHDTTGKCVLLSTWSEYPARDQYKNSTWLLTDVDWSLLEEGPIAYSVIGAVYDNARDVCVAIGSTYENSTYATGVWEITGNVSRFVPFPAGLLPKSSAGLAYHDRLGLTFMFGGRTGSPSPNNDLWCWDGVQWRLVTIGNAKPPPQVYARIAYDRKRDCLVNVCDSTCEVWEWTLAGGWRVAPAIMKPAPRIAEALAYDPISQRVALLGGGAPATFKPVWDGWYWDGQSWTPAVPQTPSVHPVGWAQTMAYVPALSGMVTVALGQDNVTSRAEAWLWQDGRWQKLPNTFPWTDPTLSIHAYGQVYDAGRRRFRVLGKHAVDGFALDLQATQPWVGAGEVLDLLVDVPELGGHTCVLGLSYHDRPGLPLISSGLGYQELWPLMPDALLNASLQAGLRGALDSFGACRFLVPTPRSPHLVGQSFFASALVLDWAKGTPLRATQALRLGIGR